MRRKTSGRRPHLDGLDVPGREFYANVLSDGVILLTAHFLSQDVRNDNGYTVNLLLRSVDRGVSWERSVITTEHVPGADPKEPSINTTRNVLELRDGTLLYGVSAAYGHDYLWRSTDRGKTWDPEPETGFFYGEMYPSILRLGGKRLLLTFTVRSVVPPRVPPLGVHAVIGKETASGFSFDFEHDRFVLDEKTPAGQASGGGFGPTIRQDDETLVSSYSYSGPGPWPNDIQMETVRWRLP